MERGEIRPPPPPPPWTERRLFFFNNNIGIGFVGPPEFTIAPKDQTVLEGENTNLPCAATAVPTPTIRWKFKDNYLPDAEVTQNGSLMIENAENNQHFEGTYTCEASNSVGTNFSTAHLTVHGKLVAKLKQYLLAKCKSGNPPPSPPVRTKVRTAGL